MFAAVFQVVVQLDLKFDFKLYYASKQASHFFLNKMFKTNMDAGLYEYIIHSNFFDFFVHNEEICFLHQDNDAKHSSNLCLKAMKDCSIKWVNNT
jgi:hypothetical protein